MKKTVLFFLSNLTVTVPCSVSAMHYDAPTVVVIDMSDTQERDEMEENSVDVCEKEAVAAIEHVLFCVRQAREFLEPDLISDHVVSGLETTIDSFLASIDYQKPFEVKADCLAKIFQFKNNLIAYIANPENMQLQYDLTMTKDKAVMSLTALKRSVQSLNGATVSSSFAGFTFLAGFFGAVALLNKITNN